MGALCSGVQPEDSPPPEPRPSPAWCDCARQDEAKRELMSADGAVPKGLRLWCAHPGCMLAVEHFGSAAELEEHRLEQHQLWPGIQPPDCLRLDDRAAGAPNPHQHTGPGRQAVLERSARDCVRAMCRFWSEQLPGCRFELLLHPPVYTCSQADELCPSPEAAAGHMKNLFLKDKKKRLYLLSALADSPVKLNQLPFAKGLSFASEQALWDKLGLIPGSVTPFGLINDKSGSVEFWLEHKAAASQWLQFHPNGCQASVAVKVDQFRQFIEQSTGHTVNVLPPAE